MSGVVDAPLFELPEYGQQIGSLYCSDRLLAQVWPDNLDQLVSIALQVLSIKVARLVSSHSAATAAKVSICACFSALRLASGPQAAAAGIHQQVKRSLVGELVGLVENLDCSDFGIGKGHGIWGYGPI
jgi:hypothetical protein